MNLQPAFITAADNFVLRNSRPATPVEFPHLCRIFNDMKLRQYCDRALILMVGRTDRAGLAIRQSPDSGTVLIDEGSFADMSDDAIRFLVAHEVGHFISWCRQKSRPKADSPGKHLPPPLSRLLARTSREMLADIAAVSECGYIEPAVEFLCRWDDDIKSLFFNHQKPIPEKFYGDFETALRLQALGLLAGSEYWRELRETGININRDDSVATAAHWNNLGGLFSPYLDFSEEDVLNLGAVVGAGLYIAGCRAGEMGWYRELETLDDYGEPARLLDFKTVEDAYDTIEARSQNIKGIRHPYRL